MTRTCYFSQEIVEPEPEPESALFDGCESFLSHLQKQADDEGEDTDVAEDGAETKDDHKDDPMAEVDTGVKNELLEICTIMSLSLCEISYNMLTAI